MRRISVPCGVSLVFTLALVVIAWQYHSLVPEGARVITHWNANNQPDGWSTWTWNLYILIVVAVVVAIVSVILHLMVADADRTRFASDMIDLFATPIAVVLGLIGAEILDDDLPSPPGQTLLGPRRLGAIVLGILFILAALATLRSRRVLIPHMSDLQHYPPNPEGSCLIDLTQPRIRIAWASMIAGSGVIGIVSTLLVSQNGVKIPVLGFFGGVPMLSLTILPLIAFAVSYAMSNTAALRFSRADQTSSTVD